MPSTVVGSVPRGEDYFGQEELIERLWARLQRDNVLLVAPRRFGKTAAMYRLKDEPRPPFEPVYVDVEHVASSADFMIELLAALSRHERFRAVLGRLWTGVRGAGDLLRDLVGSVELGAVKVELRQKTDIPANWRAYGDRLMELLARETDTLLLIDEFPILVNRIAGRDVAEAEELLHWFRAARLLPDSRTRFVVGGSINLETTLEALGLVGTINDLAKVPVRPWDADTARAFTAAVLAGEGLDAPAEVVDRILELVGTPIPYLLQVLVSAIIERCRAGRVPPSHSLVDAAFEEDLLGGATAAVFGHYRSRLDQYYDDAEKLPAKQVLGLLSRSDEPLQRATLYQRFVQTGALRPGPAAQERFLALMARLENDFYVVFDAQAERYAFHSRVLQLWWRRRYGFQES